jgi:hypothetical protein
MNGKELLGGGMIVIPLLATVLALGSWEALVILLAGMGVSAWVVIAIGLIDGSL